MPTSRRYAAHAIIATLLVAACTSTHEALIERGYPPAYAQGYEDGCASGKATGGGLFAQARKDESRYADSASPYARGWNAGYAKCLGDMRAMVARLPNAELHEISSVYGHDAFLKENRHLKPIFANVLFNQDPAP